MEFAFRATVMTLAVLSANVAVGQMRPTSLTQFLTTRSGGACNSSCCPTPSCEPQCCPEPACEPACCPAPTCGCEQPSCDTCCQPRSRQYPLEALLSRMDRALSRRGSQCNSCAPCDSSVCEPQPCGQCEQSCGRRQRYTKPCDPCGFDLWPCVGECSNMCPSGHGQGHAAPPAAIDPGLLRPYDERQIDPFMDDPDQPPRPPMSPTGVRGARLHPAIQHRYSR